MQMEAPSDIEATASSVEDSVSLPGQYSVGSRNHEIGRCKPCAFYHTKGCTSGEQCLFCHLCPAHEKQRRKRLRRQICHDLMNSYDMHPRERHNKQQDNWKKTQSPKNPSQAAGHVRHVRQNSDASNQTCSTACTRPLSSEERGQHSRQHSRQWSGSTQESASGSPSSATALKSMVLPSQDQSMYVFSPSSQQQQQQQMMSPMGVMQPLVFFVPAPAPSVATQSVEGGRWADVAKGDRDDTWEPVPEPAAEEAGHSGWSRAGPDPGVIGTRGSAEVTWDVGSPQMTASQGQRQQQALPHAAAGYVTCNGMQYALVPVAPQPYPAGGDYPMQPPPVVPAPHQAAGQAPLPPPPLHDAACRTPGGPLSYGQSIRGIWQEKSPMVAGGEGYRPLWWA